jgi:hypothetical protein
MTWVRTRPEVLRSDVLDDPGLDGLVYTVEDALASDGWGVEATPGSLARWGYELYGGFVLSDASLGEMTDFQGEWYGLGVIDLSSGDGPPVRCVQQPTGRPDARPEGRGSGMSGQVTLKTCLRCDWAGDTKDSACPNCGVPAMEEWRWRTAGGLWRRGRADAEM